jgi:DNA repair exonuclease SbcCD ATPase subunit
VEEARRLSAEIQETAQPSNGSLAHLADLESAFWEASVESGVKVARLELQLSDQERHYTAEVEQYETQLASQERHYTAEVDQYKARLASQERHYTAEAEQYKAQIVSQERHYTAEAEQYKAQIASQERQYTAEVEEYKARLRKLQQELMRLLGRVEKAAVRLRESRRWKLVNFAAVIKAKLSTEKQLPGYGDLDKIVADYAKWRVSRAEPANTGRTATVTTQTDNSANSGERLANSESTAKPAMADRLAKPTENTCGV